MTACIATPAAVKSRSGNRITALRWAKRLRELGWRVDVLEQWDGSPCDVLIALHAVRSHSSIARHAALFPDQRRVVALTGTDIYADPIAHEVLDSIAMADRVVVLQPEALTRLPAGAQPKSMVIRQSAMAPRTKQRISPPGELQVVVLGHLRAVKNPLLAANAVMLLPPSSTVRVFHLGAATGEAWRSRADQTMAAAGGRWCWLGEKPRHEALRILAAADACVLTSIAEGGANVVTEAIACGVPVLSTRIDGSVGILGASHPGYFAVGEARELADLLARCEHDVAFLRALQAYSVELQPTVSPDRERDAWRELLEGLGGQAGR
ncbi:MAG: TIGR04348 family glycosyltransferase [Myxococcales bacterium]|nr:TIGR04348 family glycosyltransferase [Myxococcales bacterium]